MVVWEDLQLGECGHDRCQADTPMPTWGLKGFSQRPPKVRQDPVDLHKLHVLRAKYGMELLGPALFPAGGFLVRSRQTS